MFYLQVLQVQSQYLQDLQIYRLMFLSLPITKNIENGTYLEGYVVFDSLDNSEDLSIPYLGFYGDYNKEEAVEPFAFEKDENKLYGSEIINTMCDVYPALNS